MKSSYRLLAFSATTVGVAILGLVFWRQQSELTRMRTANETLAAQNAELNKTAGSGSRTAGKTSGAASMPIAGSATSHMKGTQTEPSLNAFQNASGDGEVSEAIPKGKGLKPWQTPTAPETPPALDRNRMILADASVKPVADGLVATMKFNSISNVATEKLALVIRLDKRSDARILNLVPADPSNYTDVGTRVSENGKFAIFTASIRDARSISFHLALSGPDVADVRGSCGITPFLLEVDASGAIVRDFPAQ
ncbi:MAG: hypothetical protein WCS52_02405 [bacterium]